VKPILTPGESAALDRASAERGVTVDSLMERAGRAVARATVAVAGGAYGRRAVVVCGKGNNGGDGLVAARYLSRWGMRAVAVLLADADVYRDAARANLDRARRAGVSVRAADALRRELDRADVVIDGVVGTGFRGAPEGLVGEAIEAVAQSPAPVVAVDIASGVDGATGAVAGVAVGATVTVTFGSLKPGHLLQPGARYAGAVEVADIGFPPDLVTSELEQVEPADVAAMLPFRDPESHKRSSGIVLVVGGSRTMTGAVRLMAGAAYRAGAGLVQVAVPEGIVPVVQNSLTEATFVALPQTSDGAVAEAAVEALGERLPAVDAVAVGPGLGRTDETLAFVRGLVGAATVPVVVDADGLTAFAGRTDELAKLVGADLVLTPHAGEFARLAGAEVGSDRVAAVRGLSSATGATVLLKGNPTLVAMPGGRVHVNATGGPVLATGGTGDVLTGVIAAFLARGLTPDEAATAGAYVHGLAGDLAGARLGEGATSLDVQAHVPAAVLAVRERR
jgi:ADP-dependent NAD(P)H-hydrate dehydratase / NAD(P)H-hydrate epimerase